MNCNCLGESNVIINKVREFHSINGNYLLSLNNLSRNRLLEISSNAKSSADAAGYGSGSDSISIGFGADPIASYIHSNNAGDVLAANSFANETSGDVVVRGIIAGLPCELEINFFLDIDSRLIQATLTMIKPIQIGPYKFSYQIDGLVKSGDGKILSVGGISPANDFPAISLDHFCVIRCGGLAIITILITCLPTLVIPPTYIPCVTGRAGEGAAGIAACIIDKCS